MQWADLLPRLQERGGPDRSRGQIGDCSLAHLKIDNRAAFGRVSPLRNWYLRAHRASLIQNNDPATVKNIKIFVVNRKCPQRRKDVPSVRAEIVSENIVLDDPPGVLHEDLIPRGNPDTLRGQQRAFSAVDIPEEPPLPPIARELEDAVVLPVHDKEVAKPRG